MAANNPKPWYVREALLAVGVVLCTLLIMPAAIYAVGSPLLGEYPGGAHMGSFYGDFWRDLAAGSGRVWLLMIGPYLLLTLIRMIFRAYGTRTPEDADDEAPPPAKLKKPGPAARREPTVTL